MSQHAPAPLSIVFSCNVCLIDGVYFAGKKRKNKTIKIGPIA
ncbi:hypothetical protein PALB_22440 [Pseudoalteromonas luteoviolacea B = ATCC 29581]|nr:hypothetical protein PALB_22440 [Pseudoalteromonas luteoviolacea B = ATCC 29581]